MARPSLPWPVRSILAGAAGTAAMTLTYEVERRLRHGRQELDYDDSLVPGRIVAGVMPLPAVSDREAAELGLALRWGYGSAFGIWHGPLRRHLPEPWAAAVFGATLMTATFSLFPIWGRPRHPGGGPRRSSRRASAPTSRTSRRPRSWTMRPDGPPSSR